jgi:hypothetical protein
VTNGAIDKMREDFALLNAQANAQADAQAAAAL